MYYNVRLERLYESFDQDGNIYHKRHMDIFQGQALDILLMYYFENGTWEIESAEATKIVVARHRDDRWRDDYMDPKNEDRLFEIQKEQYTFTGTTEALSPIFELLWWLSKNGKETPSLDAFYQPPTEPIRSNLPFVILKQWPHLIRTPLCRAILMFYGLTYDEVSRLTDVGVIDCLRMCNGWNDNPDLTFRGLLESYRYLPV